MQHESIDSFVKRLHRRVGEVHEMTAAAVAQAQVDRLPEVVKNRAAVLAEIAMVTEVLGADHPHWRDTIDADGRLRGLAEDIRRMSREVVAYDAVLAGRVKKRLRKIKRDMGGLYHSSRAARSYTMHSTA